jgi:hypothetical protein
MRRLLLSLVVVAIASCTSMAGPEYRPLRVYQGRDLAVVVAAVLDTFAEVGVRPVEAAPVAKGQGATVKGMATIDHLEPLSFIVEVAIVQTEDGVRVSVTAEPTDGGPPPLGGGSRPREDGGRQGCSSCPGSDPLVPVESRPRDNLRILAESRKLVRAYLVALDARLR